MTPDENRQVQDWIDEMEREEVYPAEMMEVVRYAQVIADEDGDTYTGLRSALLALTR